MIQFYYNYNKYFLFFYLIIYITTYVDCIQEKKPFYDSLITVSEDTIVSEKARSKIGETNPWPALSAPLRGAAEAYFTGQQHGRGYPHCQGTSQEMCNPCVGWLIQPTEQFCQDAVDECFKTMCTPLCRRIVWGCEIDFGSFQDESDDPSYEEGLCSQFKADGCVKEVGCCPEDENLFEYVSEWAYFDKYPDSRFPSPNCLTGPDPKLCAKCNSEVKVKLLLHDCPYTTVDDEHQQYSKEYDFFLQLSEIAHENTRLQRLRRLKSTKPNVLQPNDFIIDDKPVTSLKVKPSIKPTSTSTNNNKATSINKPTATKKEISINKIKPAVNIKPNSNIDSKTKASPQLPASKSNKQNIQAKGHRITSSIVQALINGKNPLDGLKKAEEIKAKYNKRPLSVSEPLTKAEIHEFISKDVKFRKQMAMHFVELQQKGTLPTQLGLQVEQMLRCLMGPGLFGWPGCPAHHTLQERCERLREKIATKLGSMQAKYQSNVCKCMGCCPGDCFYPVTAKNIPKSDKGNLEKIKLT